jgi:hypothetical protein
MPLLRDPDLLAIRRSVEAVGKFSDGLLRVGPFSIGADGLMAWIPVAGEIYSAAAAAFLLIQAVRARVPLPTLLAAGVLMGGRTVITAIPVAGPLAADMLTMHRWSAKLIIRAIDRRLAAGAGAMDDAPVRPAPRWARRWSGRAPVVAVG